MLINLEATPIRGVCGAVLRLKSHPNRKIKNIQFGSVQLTLKKKSEPNQTSPMRFGFVQDKTIFCFQH